MILPVAFSCLLTTVSVLVAAPFQVINKMTSFLQTSPAPGYKPHHLQALKRREERPVPEAQKKLEALLDQHCSSSFTKMAPHAWEYGLTVSVAPEKSLEFFKTLKSHPQLSFNFLIDVTAVDWMDKREPRFEVVYQLLSLTYLHRLCVKVNIGEEKPEVDSVRPLWAAANFLEREVFDMYGILFRGHGDLRRTLLYDEFVGHPLRKDYPIRGKQPRLQLRIPELRNTADDLHREELVALPTRRTGSLPGFTGQK